MKIKADDKNLYLEIVVPRQMSGEDTYGDGKWTAPAVCVYIDENRQDFGLFHTQYLDYKDSLQATAPIAHFDSKEEALKAAKDFNLVVFYAPTTVV